MPRVARKLHRRKKQSMKSKIPKSVSTQYVSQRCESYSLVHVRDVGSRRITCLITPENPNGVEYKNIRNVLAQSQSFLRYSNLFKRFKIDYVKAVAYCNHSHEQYSATTFDYLVGFFPQYYGNTGDTLVSEIRATDQNLLVPNLRLNYSKTWSSTNLGPNGTGYSVWMPLNGETANSIVGQISVASVIDHVAGTTIHNIGCIKIYVGVSFADKNF